MKVLYVEDEFEAVFKPFMNRINYEFSEEDQIEIINSQTYEDAIDKFENNIIDVLILDMSIPKNDSDLELGVMKDYGGLDLLMELAQTDHYKRLDPKLFICSAVEKAIAAAERSEVSELITKDIIIEKDSEASKNIVDELRKIQDDESFYGKRKIQNEFKKVINIFEYHQKADVGANFIKIMYEARKKPINRDWAISYKSLIEDICVMLADYIFQPPETYYNSRLKREVPYYDEDGLSVGAYITYLQRNKDIVYPEYSGALRSSWNLSNTIQHYYKKGWKEKIKNIETGTPLKILYNTLKFFMEFLVKAYEPESKTDEVDEHENLESTEADVINNDEDAIDDSLVDEDTDEITSVDDGELSEEDSNAIDKNLTDE